MKLIVILSFWVKFDRKQTCGIGKHWFFYGDDSDITEKAGNDRTKEN